MIIYLPLFIYFIYRHLPFPGESIPLQITQKSAQKTDISPGCRALRQSDVSPVEEVRSTLGFGF